jgi:MYXO-CTERM domain-containing protein
MKTVAIVALAGIAAASSAQSVKLSFAATASEINVGDTVSWTVEAEFTGLSATGYFGGFNGDFVASDSSLGTAGNFANLMAFEGVPATANGADVNVNVFNSALLGSDDPSLGVFFTFDVTAEAEGVLSYGAAGVATLFNSEFIFDPAIEFTAFPVNSDSVSIVPAPGAMALLGLGGLVASRRRR